MDIVFVKSYYDDIIHIGGIMRKNDFQSSNNIYQVESNKEIVGNTLYTIWPYFVLVLIIGFFLFSFLVYNNWFINLILSTLTTYETYIVLTRLFNKLNQKGGRV
jgi:hypothetical protein